jgi:hypothetical protein
MAVGTDFQQSLNGALAAECAKLKDRKSGHEFVCVRPESITTPSMPAGTPLLKLAGKNLQVVEAGSTWEDPGAYCIKRSDSACVAEGGIESCLDRLPVQKKVSWVDANGVEKPYEWGAGREGKFMSIGTDRLVEYIIQYSCSSKPVGPEKTVVKSLPKFRVLRITDTTKPVCTIPAEFIHVVREASFPYYAEPATCIDSFDGKVETKRKGAYDIDKTGTYVLTYLAFDKSGNSAKPVLQTIVVQDTLKPVIQLSYGKTKELHTGAHEDRGSNDQTNSPAGLLAPGYDMSDLHSV